MVIWIERLISSSSVFFFFFFFLLSIYVLLTVLAQSVPLQTRVENKCDNFWLT